MGDGGSLAEERRGNEVDRTALVADTASDGQGAVVATGVKTPLPDPGEPTVTGAAGG